MNHKALLLVLVSCCFLFALASACEKEALTVPEPQPFDVAVEIIEPTADLVFEFGDSVFVEASFLPQGGDTAVGNIDIRYLNPDNGDELILLDYFDVERAGPYRHVLNIRSPFERGPAHLDVCAYEFQSVETGYGTEAVFDRRCDARRLFFQDEVGETFKVKTHLSLPGDGSRYDAGQDVYINYNYRKDRGDAGTLTLDVLDADGAFLTRLAEEEITSAEQAYRTLTHQFSEPGEYQLRLQANLPDGSNVNSWLTRVMVE